MLEEHHIVKDLCPYISLLSFRSVEFLRLICAFPSGYLLLKLPNYWCCFHNSIKFSGAPTDCWVVLTNAARTGAALASIDSQKQRTPELEHYSGKANITKSSYSLL